MGRPFRLLNGLSPAAAKAFSCGPISNGEALPSSFPSCECVCGLSRSHTVTVPLGGRVGHGVHRIYTGRLHSAVGDRHIWVLRIIKKEKKKDRSGLGWTGTSRSSSVCACVRLHASWRSCPAGYVWVVLAADSSPDPEVSSLEAQTHSGLWNTPFLSSKGGSRRNKNMSNVKLRWFESERSTCLAYLILPWDGNTACSKFRVEVIVSLVQIYSLDSGELLYVQNILTVHCPRLGEGNDHGRQIGLIGN